MRNYFKKIFEDTIDWIKLRTTNRYHIVNTGLEPGYYDAENLILHANFSILVDFVEVDLAYKEVSCGCEEDFGDHKFKWGRCKELGRKYLEAGCNIFNIIDKIEFTGPDDNIMSYIYSTEYNKKVLDLYIWWTEERPNRKLPDYKEKFDNNKQRCLPGLKDYFPSDRWEVMENHHKEDEEKLIELMKVRRSLWA